MIVIVFYFIFITKQQQQQNLSLILYINKASFVRLYLVSSRLHILNLI